MRLQSITCILALIWCGSPALAVAQEKGVPFIPEALFSATTAQKKPVKCLVYNGQAVPGVDFHGHFLPLKVVNNQIKMLSRRAAQPHRQIFVQAAANAKTTMRLSEMACQRARRVNSKAVASLYSLKPRNVLPGAVAQLKAKNGDRIRMVTLNEIHVPVTVVNGKQINLQVSQGITPGLIAYAAPNGSGTVNAKYGVVGVSPVKLTAAQTASQYGKNSFDVDKNGIVDSADLEQIVVALDTPGIPSGALASVNQVDVNSDGKVLPSDALLLKAYLALTSQG